MGSELHVTSKYGEGSDFYFDVILPNADPIEKQDNRADAENRPAFVAEDMEILVVDDTPINLKVISSLLKRNKVKVDTAESGEQAIEKSVLKKYDVTIE